MKTVCFDIDTQLDFLYPAGALYVPGAETVVAEVAAMNRWALSRRIPVISTIDAHSEDDPEFKRWPPHCVAGTWGQQKPASTLLEKRVVVSNTDAPYTLEGAQQIVIEKQTFDCFTNRHLTRILDTLGAERCLVYGVVTEICVSLAALGLLKTGRKVELVEKAVRHLREEKRDKFLAEFRSAGGTIYHDHPGQ